MVSGNKTIADVLFEQGILTQDSLSQVRLENINTGKSIDIILHEKQLANDKQIAQARSILLSIPFADVTTMQIPAQVLARVPEPVAKHYNLIPFAIEGDMLSVAMTDPLDLQVLEFLEAKTAIKVKPYLGLLKDIRKAIDEQYSASIESEVREAIRETQTETQELEERLKDIGKVEEVVRDAPVARIVSTILEYAVKSRASDIHIEPDVEKTRVRYRIDGVLRERIFLPNVVHDSVVSRIKILSDLKIDERRIPQDGRFSIKVANQEVDLRVSTLPTSHGEKVVLRLLRKTGGLPKLSDLGLRGRALKIFEENLLRPHGIILVTGPTGSGKSTTLYAALSKLNTPKVNIVTLEDPVEITIQGINQVQINIDAGLTFASGLRAFLRQDPNIIQVGEIRDNETASLAVQAALTGHLVLSTLHTNDAATALPRLIDMGIEPFLLSSTINIVMAQRLTRRICQECIEDYEAAPEVAKRIQDELGELLPKDAVHAGKITLKRGKGCKVCSETGYRDRTGIYEVLNISEKISQLIVKRSPSNIINQQALEDGMIRLVQDGFLKALEGITTLEEVLRVAAS